MTIAYVALGSNLNNPAGQLRDGIKALSQLPNSRLELVSSAYRSAAVGPGAQPDYLNAVAKLTTQLPPTQLLHAMQAIEDAQGRTREQRWGARTLDLDIILYGAREIHSAELQVPHPRMSERNFVLYPLAEIAGKHLVLPCGGVLESLLTKCPQGELQEMQLSLASTHNTK